MIEIKIIESQGLIEVKGHAMYDDKGKDIVCAGVSSITTGFVNYFEKLALKEKELKLTNKEQFVSKVTVVKGKDAKVRIKYDTRSLSNVLIVRQVLIPMYEQFDIEELKDYVNVKVVRRNYGNKQNRS